MIWDIIQQSLFDQYFQDLSKLTIQTLLLDENIITEFKNLNPKLIDQQLFIQRSNLFSLSSHKQQFLQKLIKYTVILPQQNDTQDRIRKLPYVSSEVLSIDNQLIYKSILQDNSSLSEQAQQINSTESPQIDYFSKLMSIFSTPAAQNQILLGYFVKIIQSLYKSEKKNTAAKIFQHKDIFFKHLNKQSVGNVFKLLLILLQTEDGYMLDERKIIIKMEEQQVVKLVAKNVLIDVIMKFQTFSSGDQLLNQILCSEKLVEIFNIHDSQAIDDFMIGYLTKAMQRICTEGNSQKQLITIAENHKELIKSYIKAKKTIFIQKEQISNFKNQTREFVKKTDKRIIKLLTLIKLSLQNGILNFLQPEDIENLWKLIVTHEFNDIIKVKIFEIFSLIYIKKDQLAKNQFQTTYFDQSISIFRKSKDMFGYFLYQLWKVQSKRSKIFSEVPEKYGESWKQINQHMLKYERYQEQTKKVIDRYSNRTKVVKLVVDEEDSTTTTVSYEEKDSHDQTKNIIQKQVKQSIVIVQKQHQVKQKSQKNSDPFDFSFQTTASNTNNKLSETRNQKIQANPFAAFDFFDSKQTKKQQLKTEQQKKINTIRKKF